MLTRGPSSPFLLVDWESLRRIYFDFVVDMTPRGLYRMLIDDGLTGGWPGEAAAKSTIAIVHLGGTADGSDIERPQTDTSTCLSQYHAPPGTRRNEHGLSSDASSESEAPLLHHACAERIRMRVNAQLDLENSTQP